VVDESRALMDRVEELGGAVLAIENGFYQQQIQESAYKHQQLVEAGERVIVGVNRFTETGQPQVEILRLDAQLEAEQIERLRRVRAQRDSSAVSRGLDAVRRGAEGDENLLPLMREALGLDATVGEVCDALRDIFGIHQPSAAF
jgi:methylmalonyl-CoA mutase N-terminal domain/subunit